MVDQQTAEEAVFGRGYELGEHAGGTGYEQAQLRMFDNEGTVGFRSAAHAFPVECLVENVSVAAKILCHRVVQRFQFGFEQEG